MRVGHAGVLPEDRADVLLHSYDGGGVTIQGPSLLVRKQFAQKFSVSANHYVDKVNSASIDVVTTASPYEEERTQQSVGLDYLHDRWMMNIGFVNSEENDYTADTFSFGISQDIFGDLTTVSLGYSLGNDTVGRRGDANFSEETERQHYRLGLSQILTKNLMLGFSFETITDEGFLNNPYRQVRYLDPTTPQGYSYEREVYPRTRSSDARGDSPTVCASFWMVERPSRCRAARILTSMRSSAGGRLAAMDVPEPYSSASSLTGTM